MASQKPVEAMSLKERLDAVRANLDEANSRLSTLEARSPRSARGLGSPRKGADAPEVGFSVTSPVNAVSTTVAASAPEQEKPMPSVVQAASPRIAQDEADKGDAFGDAATVDAATRIQAILRGKAGRAEVKEKRAAAEPAEETKTSPQGWDRVREELKKPKSKLKPRGRGIFHDSDDEFVWWKIWKWWRPFQHSKEEQGHWTIVLLKWFLPGFLNGCCIFTSMWLLHIATYKYVHRMTSMDGALKSHSAIDPNGFMQDFGGLQDPAADLFPKKDLPLDALDAVAAIFPMTFMAGVFFFDDLRLYTKVMVCNGILALLKGTVDAMTVLPDSAGWDACQERLTPFGVHFFQQDHSWFDLFKYEATGVDGHRLRWCSDMLISGHTYFTTLYALGTYELVRVVSRASPDDSPAQMRKMATVRVIGLFVIAIIAIGEQLVEVVFVTVDRFHYTMDIYIAIFLTFVIYTNSIPTIISKSYWSWKSIVEVDLNDENGVMESQADILIPICCIPFCCFGGRRYHVYDDEHVTAILQKVNTKGNIKDNLKVNASWGMDMGEGVTCADFLRQKKQKVKLNYVKFRQKLAGDTQELGDIMYDSQTSIDTSATGPTFVQNPTSKFGKSWAEWRPLLTSYEDQQQKWSQVLLKWFVPGFINGCCILTSMWLLHIATYQYVHRMTAMEKDLKQKYTYDNSETFDFIQQFGAVLDPAASLFKRQNLSLSTLDAVAAIFPAVFMLGVFVFDNLRLYTKVMVCNGIMALLKGTLDAMTILPDSGGWEACKERLTPEGVSFFQDEHSFIGLFFNEIFGVNGHRYRWCSDMLVSGHTYFTTVYALGTYELVRSLTARVGDRDRVGTKMRLFYVFLIVVLAIAEQSLEVYYVIVDRFHYTMDIYMAIIITFAVYTNAVPILLAKYWWYKGSRYAEQDAKLSGHNVMNAMNSQADILLPICCVPFCCFAGRLHVYDDAHVNQMTDFLQASVQDKKIIRRRASVSMGTTEGVGWQDFMSTVGGRSRTSGHFDGTMTEPLMKETSEGIIDYWQKTASRGTKSMPVPQNVDCV